MSEIVDRQSKDRLKVYSWTDPYAFRIKALLQMAIGLGIIIILGAKLFSLYGGDVPDILIQFIGIKTLKIVGKGLAYAAGVELAYMLFTPGPDEAIEPVILAIASALIMSVSQVGGLESINLAAILVYILALSILFLVRELFVKPEPLPELGSLRIWIQNLFKKDKKKAKQVRSSQENEQKESQ